MKLHNTDDEKNNNNNNSNNKKCDVSGNYSTTNTNASTSISSEFVNSNSNKRQQGGVWPTVTVPYCDFPILSCVSYVGKVVGKFAKLRRIFPASLA